MVFLAIPIPPPNTKLPDWILCDWYVPCIIEFPPTFIFPPILVFLVIPIPPPNTKLPDWILCESTVPCIIELSPTLILPPILIFLAIPIPPFIIQEPDVVLKELVVFLTRRNPDVEIFSVTDNELFISEKVLLFNKFKLPNTLISPPIVIFFVIPIPPLVIKLPEFILLLSTAFWIEIKPLECI